jgi:3-oxoadipate enol-lactonase
MADYAADAAGVLDLVGWEQAAVVGVSFGGMVAQELAIGWPDRVERLVLCCTSSGGEGGSSYPLHELSELTAADRYRAQLAISDERYDRAWQDAHPEDAERLLAMVRAGDTLSADDPHVVAGARHQLEARREHDTFDRLDRITAPTLVCAGCYDALAPLGNSEALAAAIPGAELQVFDGGHLFLLQDPQSWPAIIAFLAGGQDR